MFLCSLLQRSDVELVKRVFDIQRKIQIENSWVQVVKRELADCEIHLSFEEISLCTKTQFKSLVSRKVSEYSKRYLFEIQQKRSKTKNLIISEKIKPYLISDKISLIEKQTLYQLRCRIEKVKNNYKSSYKNNLECLFCKSENSIDSVQHYLESCSYFKQKDHFHKKIKGVKYEHIFNGSFEEQVRVVRIWLKIQEHRKLVDLT